ncbi:MAG: tetratricopeptide repeat protein [Candidatus Mcinerneyibacterium aminivorans]|uniref:Tetratricopeptide repeat protein n=1 Tax=Candidatus Mcinerneyibacterium aminivorans TaxID=2703815 RepID=A0A5D0MFL3_9BACT|nr:MAG: tetratricopeptide repeat protein [Candidatus Mcinerneyibacterium aminivorans]
MSIFTKIFLFFWRRKAFNGFVQGNYEKALKYFKKIYQKKSNEKGIRYNLGLTYIALGRYQKAEKYLKEQYERDQHYINAKALGDLYYLWGNAEKASEFYSKALLGADNKKDKNFLNRRIEICEDKEKFEQAQKAKEILEEANELMNKDSYEQAIEKFKQSIDYDHTNFIAFNNLATIYMNQFQEYEKALKYFEKANDLTENPVIKKNISNLKKAINDK